MPKLTETYVRKIPPAKSGTKKHWDTEVKGLVLFVGKRAKTWYFQKDVGGQTRRVLIGRYPTIPAAAAREVALGYALEWGRGSGKTVMLNAPSLADAMEAYLARPKLRSQAHKDGLRAQFDKHLWDWMGLPLDEITKSMVVERHRSLASTPSTANHLLKYFRTVWNYARRTRDLAECPTMAIEWYEEVPAGEIITDLHAWRDDIDGLRNPIHTIYYELLLFTGFRKSEALFLQWQHVHDGHIHLPMTKNGRSFDLPITSVHHKILKPMRRYKSPWVFPSPKNPENHLAAPQRMRWSPHSHRRTFATIAMEAGIMEEIVGRLLNHTPLSITGQRYAKPSVDALRPAMEAISEEIQSRLSQ
jgi:integrase